MLKARFEVAAPTNRLNMPTLINIGFQLCNANNNEGKIKGPSETAIVRHVGVCVCTNKLSKHVSS